MIFHVEFYDRATGTLEHNDSYTSLEGAFSDAHGRLVIVTRVECKKSIAKADGGR